MQLCLTQKPLPEVKTAADNPNAFTAAVTHLRLIKMAISLHVFGTTLKCRTTCTLRAIGAGLSQPRCFDTNSTWSRLGLYLYHNGVWNTSFRHSAILEFILKPRVLCYLHWESVAALTSLALTLAGCTLLSENKSNQERRWKRRRRRSRRGRPFPGMISPRAVHHVLHFYIKDRPPIAGSFTLSIVFSARWHRGGWAPAWRHSHSSPPQPPPENCVSSFFYHQHRRQTNKNNARTFLAFPFLVRPTTFVRFAGAATALTANEPN